MNCLQLGLLHSIHMKRKGTSWSSFTAKIFGVDIGEVISKDDSYVFLHKLLTMGNESQIVCRSLYIEEFTLKSPALQKEEIVSFAFRVGKLSQEIGLGCMISFLFQLHNIFPNLLLYFLNILSSLSFFSTYLLSSQCGLIKDESFYVCFV